MARHVKIRPLDSFERVIAAASGWPDVEAGTKYDGSPVLKVGGVFLAGVAMHASAERGTLVVRADYENRERLIEDAPDIYYVTDYYGPHPVVLVRLSRLDAEALRDLLSMSRRLSLPKARNHPRAPRQAN
jgi:hypothetical protein